MPVGQHWHTDAQLLGAVTDRFSVDFAQRIGVAVSGGGDSMALLHLMHQSGRAVEAVTVNHGLRPQAAAEAVAVGAFCTRIGVVHTVLHWAGPGPTGNLMDQARRARLTLMADWAVGRGISQIVLGHTADDQAETFLMGLARTAGLDGLSGMRPEWQERGITWRRPLLLVPRETLRAYLVRHAMDWAEDPTNDDDKYTRTKARRAMQALRPLGITVERLGGTIANLATAQQALSKAVAAAALADVLESAGALTVERRALDDLATEVRRRLLIAALRWVSGAPYAPRAEALLRAERGISEGRDCTLAGCRIRVSGGDVLIVREPKAVAGLVSAPAQLWDGRWRLEGPTAPELQVRALGAEGLRACKNWRATGYSRDALMVTPAVWRADRLISAPIAGFAAGWTAQIPVGFALFVQSH